MYGLATDRLGQQTGVNGIDHLIEEGKMLDIRLLQTLVVVLKRSIDFRPNQFPDEVKA